MSIILFLEHKFYLDEEKNILYSQKVINDRILTRYTEVYEKVIICARRVYIRDPNAIRIENKNVSLLELPDCNFSGLLKKYKQIKKTIIDSSNDVSGFIIRAPSTISFLAYKAVKNLHKPIMTEMVINPNHFFLSSKNDSIIRRTINWLCRQYAIFHTKTLCKNSNAVLYVTKEYLQHSYKSYDMIKGEDKNHFSIGCSDVVLDDMQFNITPANHDLNNSFAICHMGWMNGYNKGHVIVLDILKKLLDNGYNCNCFFIGDGIMKETFINYAAKLQITNNVQFIGQLNSFSEIQSVFSKSHLFLFPSINEGLPRVLIEAMANSIPCIAYRTDGIPELIDSNYLAEIGDINKLYRLVTQLYENETLRKEIAKKNYEKAKEYKDSELAPIRKQFYLKFKGLF